MIVKVLSENIALAEGLGHEHGLSLHIESMGDNILFDTGCGEIFYENAQKMGVDIGEVDYLIISHGHNDHGGGLETFLKHNDKARVFIHKEAFLGHYALKGDSYIEDIGLDKKFENHPRVVLTNGSFVIRPGLTIFANKVKNSPRSESNAGLLMEGDEGPVPDDFAHEQNLIVEENGKVLMITGCAHNGITNIVEQHQLLTGSMPDYCMGGFHLTSRASGSGDGPENFEAVERVGKFLMKEKTKYYTGHCTGLEPYEVLKTIMGDKVEYLGGGKTIEI